ncbi:DNA helicase [Tanacetum coccineum]
MVTAFCAVEQNRIDWVREHQNDIRHDYLSGIYDAINRGDSDGSDCGGRLILPQSFTGGPRYMYAHYLDALAICRVHGNPSYFITFTCNVKWPEIVEYMEDFPGLTTADRADVVDRVFEMKIHQFMKYLRDVKPFGKIIAIVYAVEFQKRGLPHCHTLIWVDENYRIQNHEDIDAFISAELPLPEVDPVCHRIVSEFMIHGPCGEICPTAACMKNSPKCTKYFPKEYCDHTYIDHDGFVHYRRRDIGATTVKQNVQLDNGYVVPYNKQLLKTFYAHINVEYCGWTMLIKYLFKYISKGTDRIAARITQNNTHLPSSSRQPNIIVDEIKNYLDSRYIGPYEACWRLFEFDIHSREPAVQVLAVHGQNMQPCEAMGLLGDDIKWETTLKEATSTATPSQLRTLLAHILTHCQVSNPLDLRKRTWNLMSNDIPYVASISLGIPNLHIHSSQLENYTKYKLEACLNHCSRSLTDFEIPLPPKDLMQNRLLMEEKSYDRQLLAAERDKLIHKLNNGQRNIFNLIVNVVAIGTQELIFIYDHSGTGKTFLWKTIIYALRAEGKTLLAVASSRIASLLLPSEKEEVLIFANWLLDVGDGTIGVPDESDPENASWIGIPKKFQIQDDENGLTKLIQFIYNKHTLLHPTAKDLQEKVIVCPKNDTADVINAKVMSMLPGHTTTYTSHDEAMPHGQDGGEVELLYPTEYLNILNFAGIPPHELKLKIGTPIMLLRNINIIGGLCNGTRMIVKQLLPRVIEAQIIKGTRISQKAYIPRIPLTMKDPKLPFVFKRKQFPVKVCYAMTINKSQGQSLKRIGIYLPEPVFGHGQLSMEQARDITISQQDKGKIILMEPEVTNISQLSITSYNSTIEAIGTPVQANMGLRDAEYIDQPFELRKAYRFTGFSCEPTDNWEQTLPTEITLIFGRFLQAEEIAATDFPEHYFNFVAYNKLSDRLVARNPILTVVTQLASLFGTKWHGTLMYTNTTQWKSRSLLLSVHVTTTTTMVHPPTIVRLFRLLYILANLKPVPLDTRPQLSGTSATHYYFNPSIPETQLIRQQGPVLKIIDQRYEDTEQEKLRNRFPLVVLRDIDPQDYQKLLSILSVHKGADTIKSAQHVDKNSNKSNPFQSARTMDQKQLKLTVIVNDGSATTTITCFSDQANTLTRDVNEVVAELADKDPFTLPPSLRELEGTTHIFQFYFDTMATSRRLDFILDKVFERPVLALPPSGLIQAPEPYVTPEEHHNSPEPEATLTTHQDPAEYHRQGFEQVIDERVRVMSIDPLSCVGGDGGTLGGGDIGLEMEDLVDDIEVYDG